MEVAIKNFLRRPAAYIKYVGEAKIILELTRYGKPVAILCPAGVALNLSGGKFEINQKVSQNEFIEDLSDDGENYSETLDNTKPDGIGVPVEKRNKTVSKQVETPLLSSPLILSSPLPPPLPRGELVSSIPPTPPHREGGVINQSLISHKNKIDSDVPEQVFTKKSAPHSAAEPPPDGSLKPLSASKTPPKGFNTSQGETPCTPQPGGGPPGTPPVKPVKPEEVLIPHTRQGISLRGFLGLTSHPVSGGTLASPTTTQTPLASELRGEKASPNSEVALSPLNPVKAGLEPSKSKSVMARENLIKNALHTQTKRNQELLEEAKRRQVIPGPPWEHIPLVSIPIPRELEKNLSPQAQIDRVYRAYSEVLRKKLLYKGPLAIPFGAPHKSKYAAMLLKAALLLIEKQIEPLCWVSFCCNFWATSEDNTKKEKSKIPPLQWVFSEKVILGFRHKCRDSSEGLLTPKVFTPAALLELTEKYKTFERASLYTDNLNYDSIKNLFSHYFPERVYSRILDEVCLEIDQKKQLWARQIALGEWIPEWLT